MLLLVTAQQGTRTDFADMYTVLQVVPFRRVAHDVLQMYGPAAVEPLAIGKGLVWFELADSEEDPTYVGSPVAWKSVRDFFRSSLRQFVLDLNTERELMIGGLADPKRISRATTTE